MVAPGSQSPYQQLQLFYFARTITPPGCARDTLHIVLAALDNPGATGPTAEALASLDPVRRGQLQAALRVAIDLNREQLAIGEGERSTERLRQCEGLWQQQSLQQPLVGLTSALVLGTIVGNDQVVQGIFRACGIEPSAFYQALQPKFAVPEALSTNNSGAAAQGAPFTNFANSGPWPMPRVPDKAEELAKLVGPTPSREFRLRHPVAAGNLLNALSSAAGSPEVPIAFGRRGSPLETLIQVLADCVAVGNFTGPQVSLNRYKAVYSLDAHVLLGLARNPTELAPDKVFEQVKLLIQQREAILVVNHVEAWRGPGVPEALRWHLGNPGSTLICGLYEATDEQAVSTEATLGLPNAALVRINTYTADETRDFLKTYAMAHWGSSGFGFTSNAFDSIYKLEPGCWIRFRRMTLPYLATALGDQTIQTAMRGDDAIRQTAQEGLVGLKTARDELASAAAGLKGTYEPILREVEDDLNNLLRHPVPKVSGSYKMLTRGHVVAQLFCPNESEFHLPGFTPGAV